MKNNKGITMIVLILTIVVIVIITGATIATAGSFIENSKVITFAEDLKGVEDATKLYYIENDDMPILGDKVAMSYSQVKSMIDTKNLVYFETEATENGDKPTSDSLGAFYKIDLGKIGVTKITRGIQANGDENDVFVVSYPSMNIYYINGVSARGKVYFSLTKEISNVTNINKGDLTNVNTDVVSSFGITVRKENKTWTNKPNFLIEASIEPGESLYIKFGSLGTEKQISTQLGQNSIHFGDTLKSYVLNNENKYNLSITDTEISTFNNLAQSEKYFEVIKKSGSTVLGTVKVEMSNYETKSPIKNANTKFEVKDEYNVITVSVNDTISGVKEVKYEYLSKIDQSGNIVRYYKDKEGNDITSFDSDYMLARGKNARALGNGLYSINVPKDVEGIEVMVYDKAGNSFLMTENTNIQNTSAALWAGIFENYVSSTQLSLNFTAKTDHTINEAKVFLSNDGSVYGNEAFLEFTKKSSGVYTAYMSYSNLNLYDNVYVKLEITYNTATMTETVVKKLTVKQDDDYVYAYPGVTVLGENKPYIDKNGDEAIIPQGFRISGNANEQTINTGLVIIGPDNSEFVWVPVPEDEINLFYEERYGIRLGLLWKFTKYGNPTGELTDEYGEAGWLYGYNENTTNLNIVNNILNTNFIEPGELAELISYDYNIICTSIGKYEGFYIGRYETGNASKEIVVSQKGNSDISNQDWYTYYAKQKKYASSLTSSNIKSHMIFGSMWDATLRWFAKNANSDVKKYSVDSELYGNYSGTALTTGSSVSVNNIYDMAGNMGEYTMAISDSGRVIRGGVFASPEVEWYSGYAVGIAPTSKNLQLNGNTYECLGSRLCLYL